MPEAQAHPALRPYVARYVGYRHDGAPAVHHGIPSASTTVILAFDEPLQVSWADAPTRRTVLWTLAAGLHVRPTLVHTGGRQHGIQLQLTPLGVRALLGVPAGPLAGQLVAHADLPLGVDEGLLAALAELPSWVERFAVLDAALLRGLASSGERRAAGMSPAAREGWRTLAAVGGVRSVRDVAAATGWSARTLHTHFVAEFGVSPKQAAQLMRLDRARALVARGLGLADVAARAGYADQAHLTREWTRFAGQPPRRTLAELAQFTEG